MRAEGTSRVSLSIETAELIHIRDALRRYAGVVLSYVWFARLLGDAKSQQDGARHSENL